MGEVCGNNYDLLLPDLIRKTKGCSAPVSMIGMSSAFTGLRSINNDDQVVLEYIFALTQQFKRSEEIFGAQAVGNSLYGLQNMKSDCNEVRKQACSFRDTDTSK